MAADAPLLAGNGRDANSLSVGLAASARELGRGRDRQALQRLAEFLRRGASLEDPSLAQKGVSAELVELVKAGSQTGRLPQFLNDYLSTSRMIQELRRSLFLGLIYPTFLMVVGMALVGGALVIAREFFGSLLGDFGVELPGITILAFALGDLISEYWSIPFVLFGLCVLLFLVRSYLPWKIQRTVLFQSLPIIGTAQRSLASAEFCRRLATLTEAGLPLEQSLRVLAKSLHDARLRAVSAMLAEEVEDGTEPATFAVGVPGMLIPLSGTFRWCTAPDLFIEGLRAQAEIFENRARTKNDQIPLIMAPLVIVMLGGSILFLTAAYFFPMASLLNDLS